MANGNGITKDTKISVGLALALVTVLVGSALHNVSVKADMARQGQKLVELERRLEEECERSKAIDEAAGPHHNHDDRYVPREAYELQIEAIRKATARVEALLKER